MKKTDWKSKAENGAVMLFMIVIVAIMATYISSILPKSTHSYPQKKIKVLDEVQAIAFDGEDYYFDNKAFPSGGARWIANSTLNITHHNPGVLTAGNTYGDASLDDFRGASWTDSILELTYTDGLYAGPMLIDLYASTYDITSMGADETQGTSDDITRYSVNSLAAEARTRRLLDIIRARYTKYKVDNAAWNLTGTWSTDKGTLGLGAEFLVDGWGQGFLCGPAGAKVTKTYVYSKGVNKTDNSNASDDIGW